MVKRAVAALLWTYASWYAWSLYSAMAGINVLWGPVAVLAVGAFWAFLHVAGSATRAAADGKAAVPMSAPVAVAAES